MITVIQKNLKSSATPENLLFCNFYVFYQVI